MWTLCEAFDAENEGFDFTPRYNAAPMQWLPVVRQRPTGEWVIYLLRWGLVPSWAKDETIGTKLINARGETLTEKSSFRTAYRKRRCIVPANGFVDWKELPNSKQPYYVHAANDELFGLAGLWERWGPADGEAIDTFTIVTTDANGALRELHDRMPGILASEDYGRWLDQQAPLLGSSRCRSGPRVVPHPASVGRFAPSGQRMTLANSGGRFRGLACWPCIAHHGVGAKMSSTPATPDLPTV